MTYNKNTNNSELLDALSNLLNNSNNKEQLNEVLTLLSSSQKEKVSHKSKGRAKRPLTEEEYDNIIKLLRSGFTTMKDGKEVFIRPNEKVALALVLEASIGLRISDVLKLKVSHFQKKLEIREKKTNKLQYRKLNPNLIALVNRYAITNNLGMNDYIINCSPRNIQKYLKLAVDYLGYTNLGTHSFRKYFSMYVYNQTKDIRIVQTMLNHSSVAVTERYLTMDYEKIDEISSAIDFTNIYNEL